MIKIEFREKEKKSIAYDLDKQVGECDFEETNDTWNITHTEVDSAYEGQGIAKKLVENVIQNARILNKNLKATCSYAKKIIEKI
ncbi:GNAT family N-acetyltransferase [Brachyspira catarrhinii]|uniref:N-acetyltransferase n=1 Tax=Brachyspira catarrhinii TaxID=2528966 RepID=A0ABY2TSV6_9SPIR|nr:GNAT family N-acetyltransferase [Brachyspira catarrhinii]TKZ35961.1 N-acetyltransferase [Brachyspira catarrhinii]